MKLNKYFKIFVVCLYLVAFLAVSCFATSSQTTSTVATYGHYISPGDYVFDEVLAIPYSSFDLSFDFVSNKDSTILNGFYIDPDSSLFYYVSSFNDYHFAVYSPTDGWVNNDYRFLTINEGFYIYDSIGYQWWQSNVTRVSAGYDSNLLDGFLSAFTMIGQCISGAANTLTSMFWSNSSLTFLGTLAVSALAFAVAFLIIGLISRFLRFRG